VRCGSERDGSDIRTTPGFQPAYRNAAWILTSLDHAYCEASSVNEQGTQVAIAALADTQEYIAATAGMLTRHQAKPGAEFTAVF
jgi:hypothetical protein